jgi:hypothetical protein
MCGYIERGTVGRLGFVLTLLYISAWLPSNFHLGSERECKRQQILFLARSCGEARADSRWSV